MRLTVVTFETDEPARLSRKKKRELTTLYETLQEMIETVRDAESKASRHVSSKKEKGKAK